MHQSTALVGQVQFRQARQANRPAFDARAPLREEIKEELLPFTVRLTGLTKLNLTNECGGLVHD